MLPKTVIHEHEPAARLQRVQGFSLASKIRRAAEFKILAGFGDLGPLEVVRSGKNWQVRARTVGNPSPQHDLYLGSGDPRNRQPYAGDPGRGSLGNAEIDPVDVRLLRPADSVADLGRLPAHLHLQGGVH